MIRFGIHGKDDFALKSSVLVAYGNPEPMAAISGETVNGFGPGGISSTVLPVRARCSRFKV
jgi:hypothetical protein